MLQLALVVIRASDVNASRRFYEALGLQLEETDTDGYQARIGDSLMEICPALGRASEVRLGFRCSDLAHLLANVNAAGGEIAKTLGSPARYAVVRDPDGNIIELQAA